jgi:hypothetical protein
VLLPLTRTALVFEPNAAPRGVREIDTLDGGAALPDLRVPLAGVFPPIA